MHATPDNGRRTRFVNAALILLAGTLVVAGACNFTSAPIVDTSTVWMDTVQRGNLQIERRGAGQLLQSDDGELYAMLRIPETQSLDLAIGQSAMVDLRVEQAPARVVELADAIEQGTRAVRLEFVDGAPERALRGMSIDGTIEVGLVEDTLFVGKPAYGRSNTVIGIFKLDGERRFAERVQVQTGASSVSLIQILEGLEEGDEIILSDMSRWDSVDRLALR